jgi:tetratricopeptide (TPR) repeat protein
MAYGGIEATARATENYLVYDIVKVLIATSAFLHYYYDGFIWKLRKPEIRRNLVGEDEKTKAVPSLGSRFSRWFDRIYSRNWAISCFFETGKQIVYFGIPILFLAWTDKTYSVTDIEAKRYLSEMAPSVAKTFDDLGVAYNQSGDINRSIEAHKKAISTDSSFASAYTHLGIAYSRIGKREEAIRKHRVAIEIDPTLSQAYYNLGAEYMRLGKLSLATDSFASAVTIDSEYSLAHKALATLYRYQGEVKIAENHDRLAKNASNTKLNNRKNLSAMPWATGTPVE